MADGGQLNEEESIRERHRSRVEEMRREKQRQMARRRRIKKYAPFAAGILAALALAAAGVKLFHKTPAQNANYDKKEAETGRMEDDGGNNSVSADGILEDTEEENKEDTGSAETVNRELVPISRKTYIWKGGLGTIVAEELDNAGERLKEAAGKKEYKAKEDDSTLLIGDNLQSGDEFFSKHAILINLDSGSIVAWKDAETRISPASMTKILTVLVAAEHVEEEDLDDTFTITLDITDYSYRNRCSNAGFDRDEEVTVRDLFYGTILPSGADAAVGLATYVAGSQEAFVEMMNEKLEELGLSDTAHFTNCVGIYDEDHYCTVYDMAMIMEAAADNELCREVMTAHTYDTSKTEQHPEGIPISNWFLRRIEDHLEGGEVLYAKTGFVDQSGNCAASYARSSAGESYVCVTVNANSYWRCIFDHAGLYEQFFSADKGE